MSFIPLSSGAMVSHYNSIDLSQRDGGMLKCGRSLVTINSHDRFDSNLFGSQSERELRQMSSILVPELLGGFV